MGAICDGAQCFHVTRYMSLINIEYDTKWKLEEESYYNHAIVLLSPSVRITARDGGKLLNAAKEVVFISVGKFCGANFQFELSSLISSGLLKSF